MIEDVGDPRRVYARPASLHAAASTGPADILQGTVTATVGVDGARAVVSTGLREVTCRGSGLRPGDTIDVFIRPENISLQAESLGGGFAGRVERCIFSGSHWKVNVRVRDETLEVLALAGVGSTQLRPGERVHLSIRDEGYVVINEQLDGDDG